MRIFSCNFYRILRLFKHILLRAVAYCWPRDRNLIVIGGWCGELYIDNPKYLLDYLLKNTEFKVVWVGKEHIREQLPKHERLRFAVKDSLSASWNLLNAKTWVCCQAINIDLTILPILGRAICIDLWHGIPIKFIGEQTPKIKNSGLGLSVLKRLCHKLIYDWKSWIVVSNDRMVDLLCDGVPARYNKKRVLKVGTPRNDFLINHASDEKLKGQLRKKYSALLGFDSKKKIVLYLPTWRMSGDDVFTFYNQTLVLQDRWKRMLDRNNGVLIEKHHWGTYARYPSTESSLCSIAISASQQKQIDIQELLLVADLLISDYSGAYIDFALLKRPVLHFAYDLEKYTNEDSGLAYSLQDVAAGPIVLDVNELENVVNQLLKLEMFSPAEGYHKLVEYEYGTSSAKIVDFINSRSRNCYAC